ncbi:hypothetical protein WAI453_009238 [Rhynchosporium graminicola]
METTNLAKFSTEGVARIQLLGTFTRAVTVLEYFRIPYKATYVQLADVKKHSSNGLIPIITLISASPSLEINDSLSICEYLAES